MFFNLREEDLTYAGRKPIFCLVIYDIHDNKRRLKLSHLLEGYGLRVQRSCFEMLLEQSTYRKLLADLEDFYDADSHDSILVYKGKQGDKVAFSEDEGIEAEDDIFFL